MFFFAANCPGYSTDGEAIFNTVLVCGIIALHVILLADQTVQGHLCDHPEHIHDSEGALWFDPNYYHMYRALQKGIRTAIQDLRSNVKTIVSVIHMSTHVYTENKAVLPVPWESRRR
jgi:hypothetical protein